MPHLHPLSSTSVAKSPKLRMSVSCPATTSNVSAMSTRTQLRDAGVPAKYKRNPWMVRRYLKSVRDAYCEMEKNREKEPGCLKETLRMAKKIFVGENQENPVLQYLKGRDDGMAGDGLPGGQDTSTRAKPSNTTNDILPAERRAILITQPTSKTSMVAVPIEENGGNVGRARQELSTPPLDTHEVQNLNGENGGQDERTQSTGIQSTAEATLTDEVHIEGDLATALDANSTGSYSRLESPSESCESLLTDRKLNPEPARLRDLTVDAVESSCADRPTVLSLPKLRHRHSAPALLAMCPSHSGSDNTLVDFPAYSSTRWPIASDLPVGGTTKHEEDEWVVVDGRPSSSSDQFDFDNVGQYQISETGRDAVARANEQLKAAQDMFKRLLNLLAEVREANEENWVARMTKAVSRAEAAKEKEWGAEKTATGEKLVHMTGQRDALVKALTTVKGLSPPQAITSLEPSLSDDYLHHIQDDDVEVTDYVVVKNIDNKGKGPATDCDPPQPDQQSQRTQTLMIPNHLYPRIRLVENENAQLRADLERRHEDVKSVTEKADKLRALLEEDPAKADAYADILIHKELIEDLKTRLVASYEAIGRERVEVQHLRGQIEVATADVERGELERKQAVEGKETAWRQNETLLKNLRGVFDRNDFDKAFWAHYESLVKEKEGLEEDIGAYKRQRRVMMEEAVDLKQKIARLELDAPMDDDEIQSFKIQVLRLQVENSVLKAELDFRLAEQANRNERRQMPRSLPHIHDQVLEEKNAEIDMRRVRLVGQQMPQSLRDVQDQVLEGKNKEIAELRAILQARSGEEGGQEGDTRGAEGLDTCVNTPRYDYSFF